VPKKSKNTVTIGIVGGGINGLCIARELALKGNVVTLIERTELGQATSSASSRMLHGGLRYLEHGQLKFVYHALMERASWLKRYPQQTRVVENFIPIYRNQTRNRWLIGAGVKLYQWLSGRYSLGASRWWSRYQFLSRFPDAKQADLVGAWSYFDVTMDDQALMVEIISELETLGVTIKTQRTVSRLNAEGEVELANGERLHFDKIVNAAGPWASNILRSSEVSSRFHLDYIRGSHLIIDRPIAHGMVLQDDAKRVIFALPLNRQTLFGTTEVSQAGPANTGISADEKSYLIQIYNRHFKHALNPDEVVTTTSGVRPIVQSGECMSKASREAEIEVMGRLCTVFGGKWTSAPSLAIEVAKQVTAIPVVSSSEDGAGSSLTTSA
jgi:glycerol-3-phosphate dehydrogenase